MFSLLNLRSWWKRLPALTAAQIAATTEFYVSQDGEFKSVPKSIIAENLLASIGQLAAVWEFDSGVAATPGAGLLRFNHATLASVTGLEVSETSYGGVASAAFLSLLAVRDRVRITKVGGNGTAMLEAAVVSNTDNGTDRTIALSTLVATAGAFADGDHVVLSIVKQTFNQTAYAGYNGAATQTLKHINGVPTWVTDA